jgi:hypothetical protein
VKVVLNLAALVLLSKHCKMANKEAVPIIDLGPLTEVGTAREQTIRAIGDVSYCTADCPKLLQFNKHVYMYIENRRSMVPF